jgi:hypothetical protein
MIDKLEHVSGILDMGGVRLVSIKGMVQFKWAVYSFGAI